MAKIIDVRSSDGQLIILGQALRPPRDSLPPSNPLPIQGGIRFNPAPDYAYNQPGVTPLELVSNNIEFFDGQNWVSSASTVTTNDIKHGLGYLPLSPSLLGNFDPTIATTFLGAPLDLNKYGIATLDSTGKLPINQLTSAVIGAVVFRGTWDATTNQTSDHFELIPGGATPLSGAIPGDTVNVGDYYIVSATGITNLDSINDWHSGDIAIFTNIQDPPIPSTTGIWHKIDGITHEVLSVGKAETPRFPTGSTGNIPLDWFDIQGAAPIDSPHFTGIPTAPTPLIGDNSTTIPTTAFVKEQEIHLIGAVIGDGTISSSTINTTLALVASNTILANITVGDAAPSATTISALLDSTLSPIPGVTLYRGASTWSTLAIGTNGQILQTGATNNPQWIDTAVALKTIGDTPGMMLYRSGSAWTALSIGTNGQILQTGATNNPQWVDTTTILDKIPTTPAQGMMLYRNASAWTTLAAGTNKQILETQGTGANPRWVDLSVILDDTIGSTQGMILYRSATIWDVLAPGTAGYVLQTQGAGANPTWTPRSGQMIAKLIGANFNITSDQLIPLLVTVPSNGFVVRRIVVTNASISLTTAVGGIYTAASKSGVIVGNTQAYSSLTASTKFIDLTIAAQTDVATQFYLSLTTAQGVLATADVFVFADRLG